MKFTANKIKVFQHQCLRHMQWWFMDIIVVFEHIFSILFAYCLENR